MRFEILGCSGSDLPGHRLTAYRVDQELIIDAGSVTSALTIDEQAAVTDILVTHAHLDHIKDILFLADNIIEMTADGQREAVRVRGLPEVLGYIRTFLLNDKIWPDFTMLPTIQKPVLSFEPLQADETCRVAGYNVRPFNVNHAAHACGYAIWSDDPARHVVVTGDTGVNNDWPAILGGLPFEVRHLLTEVSFPNDMEELALASKHLTPRMLRREVARSGLRAKLYITHLKSSFAERILKELATELAGLDYHVLRDGDVFEF